jgi:hypothetical protein
MFGLIGILNRHSKISSHLGFIWECKDKHSLDCVVFSLPYVSFACQDSTGVRMIQNIVANISSVTGGLIESARAEKGADVVTDKSIIVTLGEVDSFASFDVY